MDQKISEYDKAMRVLVQEMTDFTKDQKEGISTIWELDQLQQRMKRVVDMNKEVRTMQDTLKAVWDFEATEEEDPMYKVLPSGAKNI